MENAIATITALTLLLIFIVLGYYNNRYSAVCDLLGEQFLSDALNTKQIISACTRKDAEKVVDAFYDRWHGLVTEWELCSMMQTLRGYIESQHDEIKELLHQTSKN